MEADALADAAEDVGDGVAHVHDSFVDEADLVTHVGELGQDVAADHDGLALCPEAAEDGTHFDAGAGVEAGEGFVEEEDLWLVQEDAGEAETLRLAAAEGVGISVALKIEIDEVELFVADLPTLGAVDAVGGGEEFEVLDNLHVVINAEEIGHVADEAADFLGVAIDRVAADIGLAVSRVEQRGQDFHRGRFARAVGTDEAKQIPRGQIELDGLDGVEVAVFFGEVVGADHGKLEVRGRKSEVRSRSFVIGHWSFAWAAWRLRGG